MAYIHLTTFIEAPVARVFDLGRSITLHQRSMNAYGEKAIGGVLNGLINVHETVTWKAKHLFKERTLTVTISSMQRPYSFVDEQVSGDFKSMRHEHFFKPCENGTIMIDQFYFESPYGVIGSWFNSLYLTKYMERLLIERNKVIKATAESNQWKQFTDEESKIR